MMRPETWTGVEEFAQMMTENIHRRRHAEAGVVVGECPLCREKGMET